MKLKFPRPPADEFEPLPVASAPFVVMLGRREFLKALAVVLAALATPATTFRRAWAAARGRFFTRQEFATLGALCDRILPPDADPGAAALRAPDYIEQLLTAFNHRVPSIFAGGPFSGRNPFPDNKLGEPSHRRPPNAFRHFIPLTPVKDLRWRAEIFGSAAVPGADFNDALLGPLIGLRDIYRSSLQHVDDVARMMNGNDFVALSAAQQDAVFQALDTGPTGVRFARDPRRGLSFIDILITHTLEACFSAPEYGGNRHLGGWKLIGLEGDDQPLGYSIFSIREDRYNERPDHPMSTPNPDEIDPTTGMLTPKPLSPDGAHIQASIAALSSLLGESC
jgi:hypothetical protein